jgi:hypothetical protein
MSFKLIAIDKLVTFEKVKDKKRIKIIKNKRKMIKESKRKNRK